LVALVQVLAVERVALAQVRVSVQGPEEAQPGAE
jgi:hypothetical protein